MLDEHYCGQERRMGWVRLLFVNMLVGVLFLLLIEGAFSIYWYQFTRSQFDSRFAIVHVIEALKADSSVKQEIDESQPIEAQSQSTKVDEIRRLRSAGTETYPSYLFDAQLHLDLSTYHLAHPTNTTIVYCNENGFWSTFQTDEIGFRNPPGQIGTEVDYIFIGDSFTEGACVGDEDTFAGAFRNEGRRVLNLGRGGSGPLFQLATLREYGKAVKTNAVVWFVFTGNDLQNLREEKGTLLYSYLNSHEFSQSLFERREELSNTLKQFLENSFDRTQRRLTLGLETPYNHAYGETLDELEAREVETEILERTAAAILSEAKSLGAELKIVLINHPDYDVRIQEITVEAIASFASSNDLAIYSLTLQRLARQRAQLYSIDGRGTHFSPAGYRFLGKEILEKLE